MHHCFRANLFFILLSNLVARANNVNPVLEQLVVGKTAVEQTYKFFIPHIFKSLLTTELDFLEPILKDPAV